MQIRWVTIDLRCFWLQFKWKAVVFDYTWFCLPFTQYVCDTCEVTDVFYCTEYWKYIFYIGLNTNNENQLSMYMQLSRLWGCVEYGWILKSYISVYISPCAIISDSLANRVWQAKLLATMVALDKISKYIWIESCVDYSRQIYRLFIRVRNNAVPTSINYK